MHTDYYVYVLFGRNGYPYYVGKGRARRARAHSIRIGYEIPTVIVREKLTNSEALATEKALIRAIGRQPYGPLVNKNPGGSGPDTLSDDARKRLSEFHKGKQWALGYRHTPETKAIIAAASRAQTRPARKVSYYQPKPRDKAAMSEKISAALTGKKLSPAHRAKVIGNLVRSGTVWITDGTKDRRISPDAALPDGWLPGRSMKPSSEAMRTIAATRWAKEKANSLP